MPDSTTHIPKNGSGTWAFDEAVAECFDDMLVRSVPLYLEVQTLIRNMIVEHVPEGGTVLDLGVSTAETFRMLGKKAESYTCIGVDNSSPMLRKAKEKYPDGTYYESDIQDFCGVGITPNQNISLAGLGIRPDAVVLSLTLQFVPIEYRSSILSAVYSAMPKGGKIYLYEKVLGADAGEQELYNALYYKFKGDSGYDQTKIVAKRKALENVLVPVTHRFNLELLSGAGFKTHTLCQWCNFVLMVGVK